jgi:hypothetical protein
MEGVHVESQPQSVVLVRVFASGYRTGVVDYPTIETVSVARVGWASLFGVPITALSLKGVVRELLFPLLMRCSSY